MSSVCPHPTLLLSTFLLAALHVPRVQAPPATTTHRPGQGTNTHDSMLYFCRDSCLVLHWFASLRPCQVASTDGFPAARSACFRLHEPNHSHRASDRRRPRRWVRDPASSSIPPLPFQASASLLWYPLSFLMHRRVLSVASSYPLGKLGYLFPGISESTFCGSVIPAPESPRFVTVSLTVTRPLRPPCLSDEPSCFDQQPCCEYKSTHF